MLVFAWLAPGQNQLARPDGIPVHDPLVTAKCGGCHVPDAQGNLQRISWVRGTPEAWEEALKRMIRRNGLMLTPPEARQIIEYLGTYHGLAPEEAVKVKYFAERRAQEESNFPSEAVRRACTNCHPFARALSWRRSPEEWQQLSNLHSTLYPDRKGPMLSDEAIAFLTRNAPLHAPEWDSWSAHLGAPKLAGRWLVTAHFPGHDNYYGEMEIESGSNATEFNTRVRLRSAQDGSVLNRSGHSLIYTGYAWRGRSQSETAGGTAPDDPSAEMREVLWFSPDQSSAEGRWYWGSYQEFGMEVRLRRDRGTPALLGIQPSSLKTGSQGKRVRLTGDHLPAELSPGLDLGPGVTVRRVVSHASNEVIAEVDVASEAVLGKHDVSAGGAALPGVLAVYDRVDYIKIVPESAVVQFGDEARSRSYQQFEAIGWQRGADGISHTADDVELGPIDVTWSIEEFSWAPGGSKPEVGVLSPTGLFLPATVSPKNNYDLWMVATARNDKDSRDRPLVGKSYLVVSVPEYTLNGRHYVRELGRWVEDGAAPR